LWTSSRSIGLWTQWSTTSGFPVFDYLRRIAVEGSAVSVYHEFGIDYFNSTSWRGRPELRGDHIDELDIHVIDYVRYLLGEPVAVQSYAYRCTGEGMCRDVYAVFYYIRAVANMSIKHGTGRSGDRYFYMRCISPQTEIRELQSIH